MTMITKIANQDSKNGVRGLNDSVMKRYLPLCYNVLGKGEKPFLNLLISDT